MNRRVCPNPDRASSGRRAVPLLRSTIVRIAVGAAVPAALLAVALPGGAVFGQAALTPAASVPLTVDKGAANALADRPAITKFVADEVALMAGEDGATAKAARERLRAEALDPKSGASFLDAYATALNDQIVKTVSATPSLRVRLNLAILANAVAERANTYQLNPAITALLKDPSDAVVLWAMRAARAGVYAAVANPAVFSKDQLIPTIVSVAEAHAKNGLIAEAAYEALGLKVKATHGQLPAEFDTPAGGVGPKVIGAMLDLLAGREKQFAAGLPEEPDAEDTAALFFAASKVLKVETPAQKQQSVQLLASIMMHLGDAAATASKGDLDVIKPAIARLGSALSVVADGTPSGATVQAALAPLGAFTFSDTGPVVNQKVQSVWPALKTAFPTLQAPTKGGSAAPATSSTAATTK